MIHPSHKMIHPSHKFLHKESSAMKNKSANQTRRSSCASTKGALEQAEGLAPGTEDVQAQEGDQIVVGPYSPDNLLVDGSRMITSGAMSQDSFPFFRKTRLGAVYYYKGSNGQSNHIYISNGSLKMAIGACFAFFLVAIVVLLLILLLIRRKL